MAGEAAAAGSGGASLSIGGEAIVGGGDGGDAGGASAPQRITHGGPPKGARRARPGDLANLSRGLTASGEEPSAADDSSAGDPGTAALGEDGADPANQPGDGEETAAPDPDAPEQQEEQQPEVDPYAEPVHGVPVDKLLELVRNGQLPIAVAEKIVVNVDDGSGHLQQMSLPQIVKEFGRRGMRERDYTKKTTELAQLSRQAQGVLESRQREMQALADPSGKGMRQWLESNNLMDAFVGAAENWGREVKWYMSLTPEQQDAYDRQMATEERARQIQAREDELNQRDNAARMRSMEQQHQSVLEQLVPKSFAKHQLPDGQRTRRLFQGNLMDIVATIPPGQFNGLTEEIVDRATWATVEELRERYADDPAPNRGNGAGNAPVQRAQQAGGQQPGVVSVRNQRPDNGGLPATALPAPTRPGIAQQRSGGRRRERVSNFAQAMERISRGG